MSATVLPPTCDVVVAGGGPAGSSAATLLQRAGLDVVLLEKAQHPRPQVGESVLPHVWKFLDLLGVADAIREEQFVKKMGGIIAWNDSLHQISFSEFGITGGSGLHVERDRFDEILLRHAETEGVRVFEKVAAQDVDIDDDGVTVTYHDHRNAAKTEGAIRCRYLVDATGYQTLMASKCQSRKLVGKGGHYVGIWGYFRNARFLGVDAHAYPDTNVHDVRPVTFVLSFADGWAWHIVLRGKTSVGLVINKDDVRKGKGKEGLEHYFLETCAGIPYLRDLLEGAEFIPGSLAVRPDYSYYNETIAGDRFFCVGDAAGFVDPIFSQGVQAAFFNATVCAWAIESILKRPQRAQAYRRIYTNQVKQYYAFIRAISFGHMDGEEGMDLALAQRLMRFLPENERELALAAAATTHRAENFLHLARQDSTNTGTTHIPIRMKPLERLFI